MLGSVNKPPRHHELDAGAWKLRVGVKNSAISMVTLVSDLILAIPIAMCALTIAKMINEAVKDSYWNCSLFIAPLRR